MKIEGKIIVITGAGQGLGQQMALHLVRQGAEVALLDLADLGETEKMCQLLNGKAHAFHCNVTDERQVDETFTEIESQIGIPDVLINNAGILRDGLLVKKSEGTVSTMSLAQFQSVMDVNVNGTFLCGRAVAAMMVEKEKSGVIINISSVAKAGNVGQTNYSASKAAVAAMTVVWAKELGRYGIRVGAIAPGVVETAMTAQMKPEAIDRLKKMVPVGSMATPCQIAEAAEFIITNDYFSGRVLELDGGLRL
ncbi:SDR family oxidoreductase [Thaumasiovibrio subtropicus]|uniref:SDR family oxidoreductase n=1 Tax=Thaumasiovibrio subtropicus TaxID=1891207 RepID=UPI000B35BC34|nr:SDR family oxidoreductase [Thaumasiovibrio subtropicus]